MESFYNFGGGSIPLTKDETLKLKSMDIPQGITTLGFAPKHLVIKPGHNLRACWLMRPDDKRASNSCTSFRALLQVLVEKDEVAICCIRKRSNDAARLHALVPQREVRACDERTIIACEGFHVVPLPFADDIRTLPPGFALSEEPEQPAVDAAKKLLKCLKFGDEFFQYLESGNMSNPSLLTQFAQIEALALSTKVDRADPVTNLDETMKLIEVPKYMIQGEVAEKIKKNVELLKAAVSAEYDVEMESKSAGGKRKREVDPEAAAKATEKKEDAQRMVSETNWSSMLANNSLSKATMPMLKAYCDAHDLKKPSAARKTDLMEVVVKHLNQLNT